MRRPKLAVLAAVGWSTVAVGCARQTAAPSAGAVESRPAAVAKEYSAPTDKTHEEASAKRLRDTLKYVDDVKALQPMQGNTIRDAVIAKLQASGSPVPRRESAAAVCASLAKVPGGRVIKREDFRAGCYLDILYATPAAFRKFDEMTTLNPTSPFRRWPHGAGRTPLLRATSNQLVVTWYAVNTPDRTFAMEVGK